MYIVDITTNDEIGITYRKIDDIDFAGCDEVFIVLNSAIAF